MFKNIILRILLSRERKGSLGQNMMKPLFFPELPHLWGLALHQDIKLEKQSAAFKPHFKCSRRECFLRETYTQSKMINLCTMRTEGASLDLGPNGTLAKDSRCMGLLELVCRRGPDLQGCR